MGLFSAARDDSSERRASHAIMEKYNRKMEAYSKSFDEFEEVVDKLEVIIRDYESRGYDKQLSDTNFALDLKYLKEQSDQYGERLNQISDLQIKDLKKQMEGAGLVLASIKEQLDENAETQELIMRKTKGSRRLLGWIAVSQMFILVGIIVLVLHTLGVLV